MDATEFQPPLVTRRMQWALIPLVALVVSNVLMKGPMPFSAGYSFPLRAFLVLLMAIFSICEVNKGVYRYLDGRLPFDQQVGKRVIWQGIGGVLVTVLAFIPVYFFSAWLAHEEPAVRTFVFSGCVALSISMAFNGVHVIRYLVRVVRYKEEKEVEVVYRAVGEGVVQVQGAGRVVDGAENERGMQGQVGAGVAEEMRVLAVETGNRTLMLDMDKIGWWHSSGGTVTIVKSDGVQFTTNYTSFAMIEDKLPGTAFFHLNRQVIAHRASIDAVQNGENGQVIVLLKAPNGSGQTLKVGVSRYKRDAFREWLGC